MANIRQQLLSLQYFDKQSVETHGNDLVRNVPTLKNTVEYFTHPNGNRCQLLNFCGTIPVHYKGNQYNIPIKLWLDQRFPDVSPFVFVVPTATMQVAERHKHVDAAGRVYLPYLHNWNRHTSSLNVLVIELMSCFAQAPPVYARRPGQSQNQQRPQQMNNYNQPQNNNNYNSQPPQYNNNNHNQYQPPSQDNKKIVQQKTTEEMKKVLDTELKKISDDIVDMMKKKYQIEKKKRSIENTFVKSSREYDRLQKRKQDLDEECKKLTSWLEENEAAETIDVDNVVSASDTHAKQLFEVTAKDYAITDVLYELEEGLGDQYLDLNLFLRQVRKISREQFFERALCKKIEALQMGGQSQPSPSFNNYTQPPANRPPVPSYNSVPQNQYPNIAPPSYNQVNRFK